MESPILIASDQYMQVSVGVVTPEGRVRPVFSLTWNTRNGGGSLAAAGPTIPTSAVEAALAQLEAVVKEARMKLAAQPVTV